MRKKKGSGHGDYVEIIVSNMIEGKLLRF